LGEKHSEINKEAIHADCVMSSARAKKQQAYLPSAHYEAQNKVELVRN